MTPALHSPSGNRVVPLRQREDPPGGGGSDLASLGMWIALAPIGMLFLAFISAYVVRRGLGGDWMPVRLPALLWANTAILLASSVTLELGRRALRRGAADAGWIWATFGLGVAFLAGQILAWFQLVDGGLDMGSTPYGSFLYLLTGTHAVHLAGGILGLLAAAVWPRDGWKAMSRAGTVHVAAIYWHFMDLLWVGIFLLLVLGR
jgi:cytochrome c oxidase subunit III